MLENFTDEQLSNEIIRRSTTESGYPPEFWLDLAWSIVHKEVKFREDRLKSSGFTEPAKEQIRQNSNTNFGFGISLEE